MFDLPIAGSDAFFDEGVLFLPLVDELIHAVLPLVVEVFIEDVPIGAFGLHQHQKGPIGRLSCSPGLFVLGGCHVFVVEEVVGLHGMEAILVSKEGDVGMASIELHDVNLGHVLHRRELVIDLCLYGEDGCRSLDVAAQPSNCSQSNSSSLIS